MPSFLYLFQICFRKFRQCSETCCIIDCHLRKHLSVHVNARVLQSIHKSTVGQTVHSRRRVDTRDPELSELTLSLALTLCYVSFWRSCRPLFLPCLFPPKFQTPSSAPVLQIRQNLLHILYIRLIGHRRLSEISLGLSRLLGQDMALIRFISL